MIRFLDITKDYWCSPKTMEEGPPVCAFVDTVSDAVMSDIHGRCVFMSEVDVMDIEEAFGTERMNRCLGVVPKGFWRKEQSND